MDDEMKGDSLRTARPVRPDLMAHLIAGYPNQEGTLAVGRALAEGGASMLELQMPSSDPAADGPVIARACEASLSGGFRLDAGFSLARELAGQCGIPVYIMAYASQIWARGVERFADDTAEAGCSGIIAPDLVPGSDEGLYRICRSFGLSCVPVIPVTTAEARVEEILSFAGHPAWVYAALRTGITGAETSLTERIIAFLEELRSRGSQTIAGFGISSGKQLDALTGHTDAVVAGSCFVRAISGALESGRDPAEAVKEKALELTGKVPG
jgi:tryptophan synthase alpha chain